MTYRERLLEKCGFDEDAAWKNVDAHDAFSLVEGRKRECARLMPIITALLDEVDKLTDAMHTLIDKTNTEWPTLINALCAHASGVNRYEMSSSRVTVDVCPSGQTMRAVCR